MLTCKASAFTRWMLISSAASIFLHTSCFADTATGSAKRSFLDWHWASKSSSKQNDPETEAAKSWALKTISKALRFSSKDYESKISVLSPDFSEQGWQGFRQFLNKSGTATFLKNSGAVNGGARETQTQISKEGSLQWIISTHIILTFMSGNQIKSQDFMVKINVKSSGQTDPSYKIEQWQIQN